MSQTKWTLKPGERLHTDDPMEELINTYVTQSTSKNLMIMTEPNMVYFVHIEEGSEMTQSDVAINYKGHYRFLPKNMGYALGKAYMLHIDLLSKSHKFLEETFS